MKTSSDFQIGKVLGVPVYLHLSTVIWGSVLAILSPELLPFAICMFGCVVLHEMGHGVMARKYGSELLNIRIYPIGGVLSVSDMQFGKQRIAIAVAGPLISLVLTAALYAPSCMGLTDLDPFTAQLIATNLLIAAFNLLPFFPLDGGVVLNGVLDLISVRRLNKRIERLRDKMEPALLETYLFNAAKIFLQQSYYVLGGIGFCGGLLFLVGAIIYILPSLGIIGILVMLISAAKIKEAANITSEQHREESPAPEAT